MVYMHGNGVSKGMGTRLLNYHIKKGNMMVVLMDLGQSLFLSTASFFVSINSIMSFNIDV